MLPSGAASGPLHWSQQAPGPALSGIPVRRAGEPEMVPAGSFQIFSKRALRSGPVMKSAASRRADTLSARAALPADGKNGVAVGREPDGMLTAAANPRGMQGYAAGR